MKEGEGRQTPKGVLTLSTVFNENLSTNAAVMKKVAVKLYKPYFSLATKR